MTENPAVAVGPTTPPRQSSPPDEHPSFEADDEEMLVKDYQDPSKSRQRRSVQGQANGERRLREQHR
eukprot:12866140-Prorocentrum_lima.AAC.1